MRCVARRARTGSIKRRSSHAMQAAQMSDEVLFFHSLRQKNRRQAQLECTCNLSPLSRVSLLPTTPPINLVSSLQ